MCGGLLTRGRTARDEHERGGSRHESDRSHHLLDPRPYRVSCPPATSRDRLDSRRGRTLVTVGAALEKAIRDLRGKDPLKPVAVVVPNPLLGVWLSRTIFAQTGHAGIDFVMAHELAWRVAMPRLLAQGHTRTPENVDIALLLGAVPAAVADPATPDYLRAAADTAGFGPAALRTLQELGGTLLAPDALEKAASAPRVRRPRTPAPDGPALARLRRRTGQGPAGHARRAVPSGRRGLARIPGRGRDRLRPRRPAAGRGGLPRSAAPAGPLRPRPRSGSGGGGAAPCRPRDRAWPGAWASPCARGRPAIRGPRSSACSSGCSLRRARPRRRRARRRSIRPCRSSPPPAARWKPSRSRG